MSEINRDHINALLKNVQDKYVENDLVSANMVKDVEIDGAINGTKVSVSLVQNYPAGDYRDVIVEEVKSALESNVNIESADVTVEQVIESHSVQRNLKRIKNIKNIIAVASGKGGVGKSTTSVNMALALAADGANVGVLDADIYGPSQPRMLGISEQQPQSNDGKTLEPLGNYGIKTMSIGFLVEEDTPMIWRGPMVTQALEQLLNDIKILKLSYK